MSYTIVFSPKAEHQLKGLEASIYKRVRQKIDSLADDPFPVGSKKLGAYEELFRVRVGDYRVVYVVENELLLVLVIALGHRKEVYRRLKILSKKYTGDYLRKIVERTQRDS